MIVAVSRVPGVSLARYKMSFAIEAVKWCRRRPRWAGYFLRPSSRTVFRGCVISSSSSPWHPTLIETSRDRFDDLLKRLLSEYLRACLNSAAWVRSFRFPCLSSVSAPVPSLSSEKRSRVAPRFVLALTFLHRSIPCVRADRSTT